MRFQGHQRRERVVPMTHGSRKHRVKLVWPISNTVTAAVGFGSAMASIFRRQMHGIIHFVRNVGFVDL